MISLLSSLLFGVYIGYLLVDKKTSDFFIHLIILSVWFNFHPLLRNII